MNNCIKQIEEGLQKKDIPTIEAGLNGAYELITNTILEGSGDNLFSFGRELNSVYYSFWAIHDLKSDIFSKYVGQVLALIIMADYLSAQLTSTATRKTVFNAPYGREVLRECSKHSGLLRKELYTHFSDVDKTKLTQTITILVADGIMRREKFGKNICYSLTIKGKIFLNS